MGVLDYVLKPYGLTYLTAFCVVDCISFLFLHMFIKLTLTTKQLLSYYFMSDLFALS